LLLLLDYDGTLVDIAPHPELARPTVELRELLGRLAARADLKVVVVSGRPVNDLQELLPVPGLDFLGSHGGEALLDGRLQSLPLAADDVRRLARWQKRLTVRLQDFQGWWIEKKPQGFALHYRQVPAERTRDFLKIVRGWQNQVRQEGRFQLLAGRKVLEILPLAASKGAAIREILILPGFVGFFPVYLGDDETDESAFQILQSCGLTIKVGRPGAETAAAGFLPDPQAVRHFLTRLAFPREKR